MQYKLKRTQLLNCEITEAWNFFSSPNNLAEITPESMKFTVLSKGLSSQIYNGMRIEYNVSPLLGITMFWRTEIRDVVEKCYFVDFQEKGPYKYWRHLHEFEITNEGILMKDTVDYQLPMGLLGDFAHWLFVKRKLKKIFDYRYRTLERIFNGN